MDPILKDHKTGTRRKDSIDLDVVMSENKEVHFVFRSKILGEFIQRLVLTAELILNVVGETVIPGPAVPEPERQPRMQGTEQCLCQAVMEQSTEKTISERNRTETVSVAKAESSSRLFHALYAISPYSLM